MCLQDVQSVAKIEQENFSRPWSEDSFRKAIEEAHTIYIIAECDSKVVGYAGIWIAAYEGEITNVSVAQEYRGQEIGRQLLEKLLIFSRKAGVTSFYLEVRTSNQKAQRLYTKQGFQVVGIRKNFYEAPLEDGIVLCKK